MLIIRYFIIFDLIKSTTKNLANPTSAVHMCITYENRCRDGASRLHNLFMFPREGRAQQKGPVLEKRLPIGGTGPSLGMTVWY